MRKTLALAAVSALALATAALPASADTQSRVTPVPLTQQQGTVPNQQFPNPPGAGPESTNETTHEGTVQERTGTTEYRSMHEQSGVMPREGGPAFPAGLEGQNLYNTHGDVVGSIKQVRGNRMVVGVGSYLGMGEHDIVLNHEEVNVSKGGKATTELSITDLQHKPRFDVQTTAPKGQSGDRFEPR